MIVVQLNKGNGIQPYYLRFVAENGETLFVSEGYATKWNAKRAFSKLVARGQQLELRDLT